MKHVVYDHIAVEYQDSKQLPFRKYIETYSLFQMAGDINGLRVLDLACGEGFYTRKLKQAGATEVLGVDISSGMIELAETIEEDRPLGCRYQVHDVATMPSTGTFDLVVAMYLLNYAKTKEGLLAFCEAAYRQLDQGGRFVGFNDNVFNEVSKYGTYARYGFTKQCNFDRQEGDAIRYTFFNQNGSFFQFNNYYLRPATYEEAFREAGFVNFKWVAPMLVPAQKENPHWDHFMKHPPMIGFTAEKK